jgi:Mn-dependent DtxR family transcriptional regulator
MKKSKNRSATLLTIDETSMEVSKEEAKEMVLRLFEQKGELDYVDIAETLDLNLKLVVEICTELEQENRIEEMK